MSNQSSTKSSNVWDMMRRQLSTRLYALVIGHPSGGPGDKATGINYSQEYFERQSKSPSKTDFHRLSAGAAFEVLKSEKVQSAIDEAIKEVVETIIERAKAGEPLLVEEEAKQDALEKKVDADKVKAKRQVKASTTKTTTKKAPAKKATASTRKTSAKRTTAKTAK